MTTLNGQLTTPYSKNKWLIFFALFFSLAGFLDSAYLTLKHFRHELPPCTIVAGCGSVLSSQYSTLGNIPVALFGAIYYVSIFLGLIAYLDSKNHRLLKYISLTTIAGLIASTYFAYLQSVIIKQWCLYCVGSILTSTLLFITGMIIYRRGFLLPDNRNSDTIPTV